MKITFAAMVDGVIVGTRSSGTRPHAAVVLVGQTDTDLSPLSWHLTHDAAHKAANGKYVAGRYPVRRVVDAVPVNISGMVLPGSPNADVWTPLAEAAMAYSAAEQGRKRDAALAEELAKLDPATAPGTPATEADLAMLADKGVSRAEAIAARLNAKADDVEVVEPAVSVSAAGDVEPVDGLRRPIVKATREAMAACAAVGLTYWSDHPTAGMVWAVDSDQHAHPVHIDRKHGTAAIGDYELSLSNASAKRVVGDSPYVPWSIDGPAEPVLSDPFSLADDETGWPFESIDGPADEAVTIADVTIDGPADEAAMVAEAVADGSDDFQSAVLGALADSGKLIVGHIGGPVAEAALPTERLSAPKLGNLEAVNTAIAQQDAEPVATAAPVGGPAPVSVTARRRLLADLVSDTLGKMVADMTADDLAALGYDTPEAVTGQIKMWLRRSGRALIYGDGNGVSSPAAAD